MTMIEVCIAMVVLLVAIGGTLGTISSHLVLGASARETSLAYLEAQRLVEQLRAEDFALVFARYNESAADDPAGIVAPGPDFAVAGLAPRESDADGRVGRISFPVEAAEPVRLREDILFNGRALDLNADGALAADDRASDYMLLPVRVRVEWKGRSGNRFVELQTVLIAP
jgi:hypothetical protein